MRRHHLLLLGFTLAACGGEPAPDTTAPPELETPVVRPQSVEQLALTAEAHALPDGLTFAGVASFSGTTLLGGDTGLFELTSAGFVQIDPAPVPARVPLESVGVVVGHPDGVSVWDGTLVDSPLTEALASMQVTALAVRGDELWIATDTALHLLKEGELSSFGVGGAEQISAFAGGDTLIAAKVALREEAGGWALRDLTPEVSATDLVPSTPGGAAEARILGAVNGALAERVPVEAGVAWRPVSLTTDEEDGGAVGIKALAVDPVSGAAWVATTDQVARIIGASVAVMAKPSEITAATELVVTADGAAWITDGLQVVRVGSDQPAVTWANDVEEFAADNCMRCHVPWGVGHPLDTYDAWKNEIDQIITQLDEGSMPQDGAALVGGTVELIRRWKTDGLRP